MNLFQVPVQEISGCDENFIIFVNYYTAKETSVKALNCKLMCDQINDWYFEYKDYLDSDFPTQLRKNFLSCMWELLLCRYFTGLKSVTLLKKNSYYRKNISCPDFCLTYKNIDGEEMKIYVEATCMGPGDYDALDYRKRQKSVYLQYTARDDFLEKFMSSIKDKIDKFHGYYSKNMHFSDRFIIAITTNPIHTEAHPLDPLIYERALFGYTERQWDYISNQIKVMSQENIIKSENQKSIPIGLFNEISNKFLSSILISASRSVYMYGLENSDRTIENPNNEFYLYHNPSAKNPIPNKLFKILNEY